MQPRMLYRTHYQADEPAMVSFIVRHCTSAVESNYSERVAERLSRYVSRRGRRFNVAAAGYAVDLARNLGVLSQNNSWTDKGHLVALTTKGACDSLETDLTLDEQERFLYFRLFLDADGALFLFLARAAMASGGLPVPKGNWNGLAQEVFVTALGEYLKVAVETRQRVELRRNLQRIVQRPFRGRTGEHKLFVHLQAMCRVGLLRRLADSTSRRYTSAGCSGRLQSLAQELRDIATLEQRMLDKEWAAVADVVLRGATAGRREMPEADIVDLLLGFYARVASTGAPLCTISTLVDALCIVLLARGFRVKSHGDVLATLVALQKQHPKDVRFHVDRRGRPVFVKISSPLVPRVKA